MQQEQQLIKRAQKGDIQAFEQLIEAYQSTVYNLAYKLFGNYDDAWDIAQEALIKIYKNMPKFQGKSKFSTWIYKITYNVCIDELRKRKKAATQSIDETFSDGEDSKITLVDPSPTPEQTLDAKELGAEILAAINALPEDQRAAVILRDVNGLSYEEISEIQGCSLGTVKSRINRARTQLKQILSPTLEQKGPSKRHNSIEGRQTP